MRLNLKSERLKWPYRIIGPPSYLRVLSTRGAHDCASAAFMSKKDSLRDPRSVLAGILGVLQPNVCAKCFIQPFIGFWLRIPCISHGLFDADDLMALRALAEAMTGAIHFVLWSKPTDVGQFLFFHADSFPQAE